LKILHVYKDYYPPVKGGIENHLNLLCTGLKDRGVEVQVLVANTGNRFETETISGVHVVKAPQWGRFSSAPLTPTFSNYLRRFGESADIIHFQYPNPTAELAYLFSNLRKKLVVTYQSDIVRQNKLGMLYSPFRKIFLKRADKIIASSPNYIHSSEVLKKLKHKCTVIPLGIDINRFCSIGDGPMVAQIKKQNGKKPIVLFVGCFRYYKGLHLLISAMKTIDARLLLIGTGPEESKLRNLAQKNNLNDKIDFLGELPDEAVNAYYTACDIFVLPSHLRSEAFGIVQLEAMACKKPVVCSELSTGTSFVNQHQKTGLVVRASDSKALASAISYLLRNPEIRREYGENGLRRVAHTFTVDKMVEATKSLYHDVVNNSDGNGQRPFP
jgi:glycosyltransferase involved in cell wall biosynthesis